MLHCLAHHLRCLPLAALEIWKGSDVSEPTGRLPPHHRYPNGAIVITWRLARDFRRPRNPSLVSLGARPLAVVSLAFCGTHQGGYLL